MKIKSITYGFKADHSAADYTFLSLRKLNEEEQKEAQNLIRKLARDEVWVGEEKIKHESWEFYSDELENMLLDKYFDIELKRDEIIPKETLKLSFDYNEEFYQKLSACHGYGDNLTSISVTKTDKKIILEINFYFSPTFESEGKYFERVYKFLKDIHKDISKGDLTILGVIGEFYNIKPYRGKINWSELGPPTENAKLLKEMLLKDSEF